MLGSIKRRGGQDAPRRRVVVNFLFETASELLSADSASADQIGAGSNQRLRVMYE